MSIISSTPVSTLMQLAQAELAGLAQGEVFTVRDLFKGYEWNRLPMGVRRQLGNVFFAFAEGAGAALIDIGPKTPQNQQQYIKK